MIFREIALFETQPKAFLRASGDDAFGFLQGQFTNELRQAPGSVAYGLWLNQKGKVVADSHVLRISEKEFVIISIDSASDVIRQRLEDYIVADDVVITDETSGIQGLLLAGPGSGALLGKVLDATPAPAAFVQSANVFVFPSRRQPGEGFEIVGPSSAIQVLQQRLLGEGVKIVGLADLEFARISAGIPVVPADIGLGDLPNEGGLEQSAISYTKGCYLGQEVMARLKNLGRVRRHLHVVRGRGVVPAALSPLHQDGNRVGEIRSTVARGDEFVALAMLSLVNLKPEQGLSLDPAGPASITVQAHG